MSNLCLVIVSSCSFGYVYFKTGPKLLFRVFFLVIVGVQGVFLPKDVMVFVIAGGDQKTRILDFPGH